jgi:hypothetical protein
MCRVWSAISTVLTGIRHGKDGPSKIGPPQSTIPNSYIHTQTNPKSLIPNLLISNPAAAHHLCLHSSLLHPSVVGARRRRASPSWGVVTRVHRRRRPADKDFFCVRICYGLVICTWLVKCTCGTHIFLFTCLEQYGDYFRNLLHILLIYNVIQLHS